MMKDRTSKAIFFVISSLVILMVFAIAASVKSPKTSASIEGGSFCQIYNEYVQVGGPESIGKLQLSDESTDKFIEELEANVVADSNLDADIAEIKAKIREFFGQYEFLDWQRFDSASAKLTKVESQYMALYDDKSNVLYVTEKCRNDGKYKETCAHELIHALTTNERVKKSIYYEGFTEYLAQQVYSTNSASYLHAFAFAECYVQKYGLERALNDYMSNTAQLDIDKQLNLPGASQDIEALIYYVDCEARLDAYPQTVILDVYYHYCEAVGVETSATTDSWLRLLLNASGGVSADTEQYLNKISSSK